MKPLQTNIIRWLLFSLEMFTLYILMIPFFIYDEHFPPIVPFIFLIGSSAVIYGWIFYKTQSVKKVMFTIPLVMLIGIVVGYHGYIAILLSLICLWRVLSNLEKISEDTHELRVFFLAFLGGMTIYFWSYLFDQKHVILLLIFAHFIYAMGIRGLAITFQSSTSEGQERRNLNWIIGGLIGVSGVALLGGLFYPILKQAFQFIIYNVTYLLSYITIPIMWLISSVFGRLPDGEGMQTGLFDSDLMSFVQNEPQLKDDAINFSLIFWFLAIVVLVVALLIVYKKFQNLKLDDNTMISTLDTAIPLDRDPINPFSIRQHFSPKNEVRRLFYHLETFLAKQGSGRKDYQTVENWIGSFDIEEAEKKVIIETYHKVRYGNTNHIPKRELAQYRETMMKVKKELKSGKRLWYN